jgi:hypothetical protein
MKQPDGETHWRGVRWETKKRRWTLKKEAEVTGAGFR